MADAFPAHAPRRRKEIYTYEAPWTIYGLSASQRPGREGEFRFALGSFMEEYANKVQVRSREGRRRVLAAATAAGGTRRGRACAPPASVMPTTRGRHDRLIAVARAPALPRAHQRALGGLRVLRHLGTRILTEHALPAPLPPRRVCAATFRALSC
jgi:hypothetical protein